MNESMEERMAGPGRYPKPDDERARRNAPTFTWTNLPARNDNPPPAPPTRPPDKRGDPQVWSPGSLEAWQRLWRSPQSTQWSEAMWPLVEQWLVLHEALITSSGALSSLGASLANIGDRLGLSPKSLLQLRWRLPASADAPVLASVAPIKASQRRDPRSS